MLSHVLLPLIVRDLAAEDLPFCDWAGSGVPDGLDRARRGEADYLVVCPPSGVPIATGGIDYVETQGAGTLYQLHVHEMLRSSGIGSLLVGVAEDHVRDRGLTRVELGVDEQSARPQRLYERLGYAAYGRRPGGWDQAEPDGSVTRCDTTIILMRKSLAARAGRGAGPSDVRDDPTSDPASHLRDATSAADLSLSDGIVRIDPLSSADADAHLAGEDVELQRWLSGGVSTPEGVSAYLHTVDDRWRDRGPIFHFAIRVEPDRQLAGTIDVQFDQDYARPGQVNLAYGLYPRWRHHGLATRAVNLALGFLRDHTDAREALIRTDPHNQASGDVARRTGFTFVRPAGETDPMDGYERLV